MNQQAATAKSIALSSRVIPPPAAMNVSWILKSITSAVYRAVAA
jgi:hypothetical protein